MLYHIHLHSEPHGSIDPSGTHRLTDYPTSEAKLTWKIVDSPVATAFIQATQMILDNQGHSDISPRNFIDWNMYGKHISWGSWKADAALLNAEMVYCANRNYVAFNSSHNISQSLSDAERANRLNRIHYAFELELENDTVQRNAEPEFFASLERLNKLVHSLEKAPNSKFGESFYVIRHSSDHVKAQFPLLTDEMYRCFENNTENGDLYSDFFTVGKDLGHAYHTNDVELIRNNEVKQQTVVSGAVAFALDNNQFGNRTNNQEQTAYWNWCKANNAELYGYDYTEPKYNLGRAPVGRATATLKQMTDTLSTTPYVVGVEIEQ